AVVFPGRRFSKTECRPAEDVRGVEGTEVRATDVGAMAHGTAGRVVPGHHAVVGDGVPGHAAADPGGTADRADRGLGPVAAPPLAEGAARMVTGATAAVGTVARKNRSRNTATRHGRFPAVVERTRQPAERAVATDLQCARAAVRGGGRVPPVPDGEHRPEPDVVAASGGEVSTDLRGRDR